MTNKLDCSIATKQNLEKKVEEHAEGERECGERKRAGREEREKEKEKETVLATLSEWGRESE